MRFEQPLPYSPTGVYTTALLEQHGVTQSRLRALTREGRLARIRKGWFSTRDANPTVVEAVTQGGLLTGPHALVPLGAWVPAGARVQVLRLGHESTSPARGEPHEVVHHRLRGSHRGLYPFGVLDWRQALRHTLRVLSLEDCVCVVDGMLHAMTVSAVARENFVDPSVILGELKRLEAGRKVARWVDPRSESIIESLARVRLRRRGFRVEVQHRLSTRERIDMVVERLVALELDGSRHGAPNQYRRDHLKAATAAREGLIPLRFSYEQVVYQWAHIEEAVEAVLTGVRPVSAQVSGLGYGA